MHKMRFCSTWGYVLGPSPARPECQVETNVVQLPGVGRVREYGPILQRSQLRPLAGQELAQERGLLLLQVTARQHECSFDKGRCHGARKLCNDAALSQKMTTTSCVLPMPLATAHCHSSVESPTRSQYCTPKPLPIPKYHCLLQLPNATSNCHCPLPLPIAAAHCHCQSPLPNTTIATA